MSSNVLPQAFLVVLVYGVLQLAKSVFPAMGTWPNNVTRAAGYLLTYALVVVNRIVLGPMHWPDLWGLVPLAAALYGGSALLYHVQDNGEESTPEATTTTTTLAPASSPLSAPPPSEPAPVSESPTPPDSGVGGSAP